jgi:hypothetical protein
LTGQSVAFRSAKGDNDRPTPSNHGTSSLACCKPTGEHDVKFWTWLLLAAWFCPAPASAAEFRPVLVVSAASGDECLADLKFLGSTVQNANFAPAIARVLSKATGIQELRGLDTSRPCGAAISTDGLVVAPVAFVPVTRLEDLLASLEPLIGPAAPQPGGVWKIGRGTLTGYVCQKDGWAYLAQSPETLKFLPDPLATLGTLPREYDAAVRIYPQHIPVALREMAIDQIRLQMRGELERRPGENDVQYALRKRMAERQFAAVEPLLTECGQVTLGWSLDRATRRAVLDVSLTPLPGTAMQRRFDELRQSTTRLAAPAGGGLALHAVLGLDAEQARQLAEDLELGRKAMLDSIQRSRSLESDIERELFSQLAGTLLDLGQATVAARRIDAATAVLGEDLPLTLIAVTGIGGPQAATRLLDRLQNLAQSDSSWAKVHLDDAKIGRLRVHSIDFNGATATPAFRRLFGDDRKLYVALADDLLVVALGADALEAIEQATERREAERAPLEFTLKLATLADVAGVWVENPSAAGLLSLAGSNLRGGDHRVTFTVAPFEQGLRCRAQAHDAVLRAAALGLSLAAIDYLSGQ